jgi:foldase protein PrsA
MLRYVSPVYKMVGCMLVFAAACSLAMGMSACGSSASEAVAKVGNSSITKATFEHWIPIKAVAGYQDVPNGPVPRGVIPDPPNYTECVAYLEATAQAAAPRSPLGQSKPPTIQLRSACRQKYQALRQEVLDFLIGAGWLAGEAADEGLKVTSGEVKHRFEMVTKSEFHTDAEFKKYLSNTHQTVADQMFRSRLKLLSAKIQQRNILERKMGVQQFLVAFMKKWSARTNCHSAYVVQGCRQYHGTSATATPVSSLP